MWALGAPAVGDQPEIMLLPEDTAELEASPPLRALFAQRRPVIGLHPGAKVPTRRWLPGRFAAVGDALAARHQPAPRRLHLGSVPPLHVCGMPHRLSLPRRRQRRSRAARGGGLAWRPASSTKARACPASIVIWISPSLPPLRAREGKHHVPQRAPIPQQSRDLPRDTARASHSLRPTGHRRAYRRGRCRDGHGMWARRRYDGHECPGRRAGAAG